MIRFSIDDSSVVEWNVSIDSSDRLISIPGVISGLIVSDNSCNDLIDLDLSRFENVKNVEIGSNALKNIKNLTMNGLNELIRFGVGSGSLNGVEIVSIGSNTLNSISSFDFSLFSNVKVIEIGSRSMNNATTVILDGLNDLESIVIGEESLRNVRE